MSAPTELAVLKTLGYSDTKVLLLVLTESLLLCLFAAAIGIGLAALVFEAPALQKLFGNFSMPLFVASMGAGIAVLVAFVSGFPPAWRARQLNIVDALGWTLSRGAHENVSSDRRGHRDELPQPAAAGEHFAGRRHRHRRRGRRAGVGAGDVDGFDSHDGKHRA